MSDKAAGHWESELLQYFAFVSGRLCYLLDKWYFGWVNEAYVWQKNCAVKMESVGVKKRRYFY